MDNHQFINGQYRRGRGAKVKLTNPATERSREPSSSPASRTSRTPYPPPRQRCPVWSGLLPGDRSTVMLAFAADVQRSAGQFAALETEQTGKSLRLATGFDVPGTIDNIYFFAGAAHQLSGLAAGE